MKYKKVVNCLTYFDELKRCINMSSVNINSTCIHGKKYDQHVMSTCFFLLL